MKTLQWMIVLLVGFATYSATAEAQDQKQGHQAPVRAFTRVDVDANYAPRALQVAIHRYQSPDGSVTVDGVYTVHVAHPLMYALHNRQFAEYEVVLMEGTKDDGTGGEGFYVRMSRQYRGMQKMLAQQLGLVHQTDHIKERPTFVNADMTLQQMDAVRLARMSETGDTDFTLQVSSGLQTALQLLQSGALDDLFQPPGSKSEEDSNGNGDAPADPFASLFQQPDPLKLRLTSARSMEKHGSAFLDARFGAFTGNAKAMENHIIVDKRNARCMTVLEEQIALGKTRIGFYWGAMHGPGMDYHIRVNMGYKPVGVRWVDAWDLQPPTVDAAEAPFPLVSE